LQQSHKPEIFIKYADIKKKWACPPGLARSDPDHPPEPPIAKRDHISTCDVFSFFALFCFLGNREEILKALV